MRARFLTELKVRRLGERWAVLAPLVLAVDALKAPALGLVAGVRAELDLELGRAYLVTVPEGFVTDFASVPRLPLVFLLAGDTAHAAAVVHDYLYSVGAPRGLADSVFMAAMRAEGVAWWRRNAMWAAVHLFGGAAWEAHQEARKGALEARGGAGR